VQGGICKFKVILISSRRSVLVTKWVRKLKEGWLSRSKIAIVYWVGEKYLLIQRGRKLSTQTIPDIVPIPTYSYWNRN